VISVCSVVNFLVGEGKNKLLRLRLRREDNAGASTEARITQQNGYAATRRTGRIEGPKKEPEDRSGS
jgi:hypothetical protein